MASKVLSGWAGLGGAEGWVARIQAGTPLMCVGDRRAGARQLDRVIEFDVLDCRITAVRVLMNLHKLRHLGGTLTGDVDG